MAQVSILGCGTVETCVGKGLGLAKLVRSFDGDIIFLVHPDCSFSRGLDAYRRLLICRRAQSLNCFVETADMRSLAVGMSGGYP